MKLDKRCAYFFLICGGILCITNTVFFIVKFNDLVIDVKDTGNIMLTIIGFLFAFAAINIYSIFNTNIDAEKGRIQELTDRYEKLLGEYKKQIVVTQDLVRFQLEIHSISGSTEMNSQLLELLKSATKTVGRFINSLNDIHDSFPREVYDKFYSDVNMVILDGKYQMTEKQAAVSQDDGYWGEKKDVYKPSGMKHMNELIEALKAFENYDFENKRPYVDSSKTQVEESTDEPGFWEKVSVFFRGILGKKSE